MNIQANAHLTPKLCDGMTVLPSFGALTGGWEIQPEAGEGVVLIVDGELFPIASRSGN